MSENGAEGVNRANIRELFLHNDAWQRRMRDRILTPTFYAKRTALYADSGRLARELQVNYGIDTLTTGPAGELLGVEEKIVRWPGAAAGQPKREGHTRFALEVAADTVRTPEKPGWLWTSQADYLLYCFADADENGMDCHLVSMPRLQAWMRRHESEFVPFTLRDTGDKARCLLVPVRRVHEEVGAWFYRAEAPAAERIEGTP